MLTIESFYICQHPFDGMCDCRKPQAGNFFKAEKDHQINLKKSFMIGDRDKDIQAGKKAGCKTIKVSESTSEISDYVTSSHSKLIKLLKKLLV